MVCVQLTGGRALQRCALHWLFRAEFRQSWSDSLSAVEHGVFETEQGRTRILVRADSIRMIEEVGDAA
jgi:hypothetical protein